MADGIGAFLHTEACTSCSCLSSTGGATGNPPKLDATDAAAGLWPYAHDSDDVTHASECGTVGGGSTLNYGQKRTRQDN